MTKLNNILSNYLLKKYQNLWIGALYHITKYGPNHLKGTKTHFNYLHGRFLLFIFFHFSSSKYKQIPHYVSSTVYIFMTYINRRYGRRKYQSSKSSYLICLIFNLAKYSKLPRDFQEKKKKFFTVVESKQLLKPLQNQQHNKQSI